MIVNTPLLRQTLARIEADPESWDQDVWRCGTTMCFAGWACTLAGGRWLGDRDGEYSTLLAAEDADTASYTFYVDGVRAIEAYDRAQRVLGLTNDQAGALFRAYNTLDDLRRLVAKLAGSAS